MKNLSNYLSGAKQAYATLKAKGTFLSLLLTICAVFIACNDEVENISQQSRATLQLNVGVNQPTSRAIVEGKTLPNTAQIGVTVVDATGTAYQQQNYNNVLYTATEVEGKQTWSTTANVTLSGEEATLYAYYPYNPDVTDITAIPVDMTEADQKDWMYATPVTGLSDGKSTAEVQLNHALTDLRLTFYKDSYSGQGKVTEFTVQSTSLAAGGTLDAKSGTITLPATQVNEITRTADFTLTDKASATPLDVMAITTGTEAPVKVSVTVDGHTYSSTTDAFTLAKATAYKLALKLTSTGLEVTSVVLTDWNEELLPDATFEPEKPEDYSDWLKLIYNVTDASQPVDIFHSGEAWGGYTFDLDDITDMVVHEASSGRAAAVPMVVNPDYQYKFTTEGDHTVYVKFKGNYIPTVAFYGCINLKKVVVPESFEAIRTSAFENCEGLTEVTFGNNVRSVGWRAFDDCTGLTKVNFPNSMRIIGDEAFYHCTGLKEIKLNEGLEEIQFQAFYCCEGLTEVNIPESVTKIGNRVFDSSNISKVIINSSNTHFGTDVFKYCGIRMIISYAENPPLLDDNSFGSNSTVIIVPKGYKDAYTDWVMGCILEEGDYILENGVYYSKDFKKILYVEKKIIGSVIIKNSIETIERNMFWGCTELTEVIIPNSVTSIGNNAFYKCTGLTSIEIPNSVTSIGQCAFEYCSGLKEVTIGSGVETIGDYAFQYCENITRVTSLAVEALDLYGNVWSLTGTKGVLIVPEGCVDTYKEWMDYHFRDWICLEEGCYLENGIYYSKDGKTVLGSDGTLSGIITIKEGVETIANKAFYRSGGLTELVIPNSVETIGEKAFYGCSALKEVTIGSAVQTIGSYAFEDCTGLAKINSLATTAPSIQSNTFYDVKFASILVVPEGCIDAYAEWMSTSSYYLGKYNWTCCVEGDYILENGIYYSADGKTVIGNDGTLSGIITIKEGVEAIHNSAFRDCIQVRMFNLPLGLKYIRNDAFYRCKGLEEIIIPETVTYLGKYAFAYCEGLSRITSLATSAPTVQSYTFYNVASNGILYVPQGATGYNTWMQTGNYYLGKYNWTIQEITE